MPGFLRIFSTRKAPRQASHRPRRPLRLETLECRTVPSILVPAEFGLPDGSDGYLVSDQNRSESLHATNQAALTIAYNQPDGAVMDASDQAYSVSGNTPHTSHRSADSAWRVEFAQRSDPGATTGFGPGGPSQLEGSPVAAAYSQPSGTTMTAHSRADEFANHTSFREYSSVSGVESGRSLVAVLGEQAVGIGLLQPLTSFVIIPSAGGTSLVVLRSTGVGLFSRRYTMIGVSVEPVVIGTIQLVMRSTNSAAAPLVAAADVSKDAADTGIVPMASRSSAPVVNDAAQTVRSSGTVTTLDPSAVAGGSAGAVQRMVEEATNASREAAIASDLERTTVTRGSGAKDREAEFASDATPLGATLADFIRQSVARAAIAVTGAWRAEQWDGHLSPNPIWTAPLTLAGAAWIQQAASVDLALEPGLWARPILCGLLPDGVAADIASLELGIQGFLERVDSVGQKAAETLPSVTLSTCLTIFAVSAAVAEVIRLQWRRTRTPSVFVVGPDGEPSSALLDSAREPLEELP